MQVTDEGSILRLTEFLSLRRNSTTIDKLICLNNKQLIVTSMNSKLRSSPQYRLFIYERVRTSICNPQLCTPLFKFFFGYAFCILMK